ncbi:MAG: septation regulator SpoVG [Fusobacteriaceae bacterium]|nr:septation regulator SpoVG [Fusobacteriaceae bacterium]MBP9509964.1 septation regulator SpoVG [Fusobacteriaceae bacterium]
MRITDVRVRLINKTELENEKLKAYADITFEDAFVVHGLKVVSGQKGIFVAMPCKKMANGEFKDIAHPIKQELRAEISEIVIKAYEEALKNNVTNKGE